MNWPGLKLIEEVIGKRLTLTSEDFKDSFHPEVHDSFLSFLKNGEFERDPNLNSSPKFSTCFEEVLIEV